MAYEKRTYPAQQGLEGAIPKQDSCPPQMAQTRTVTPLQEAQGLVDGALDELTNLVYQLEDALQDVLEPEDDDVEGVPVGPEPRCSHAVRRTQQHEDRISRLSARVVEIKSRLEC